MTQQSYNGQNRGSDDIRQTNEAAGAVESRLEQLADDWQPTAQEVADARRNTAEWRTLAHKEATGTLTRQETWEYLLNPSRHNGLTREEADSIGRLIGGERELNTGELKAARDALKKTAGDTDGDDDPVGHRLMRECQRIILQRSDLTSVYAEGLSRAAAKVEAESEKKEMEEALHNFMESRLTRALDAGWRLPEQLETLRKETATITGPNDMRLLNWTEEADKGLAGAERGNWLMKAAPDFGQQEATTQYLMNQMKTHRIGQPGEPTVDEFATAVMDTAIARDLAAEWRLGPTAYNPIPRNPHPGRDFASGDSNAKASYAWVVSDALHPDGLGTATWNGNPEEIYGTAREKATRLRAMEELLTKVVDEEWNTELNRIDPEGYQPVLKWSEGRTATWRKAMRLTENGEDLDALDREATKAQEYLTKRIEREEDSWLEEDGHDTPAALLTQEAIANLYEIRLEIYQVTLEQAIEDEESTALAEATERLEELYRNDGYPEGRIREMIEEQTGSSPGGRESEGEREAYVQQRLESVVARLAHVDFNISALHALETRGRQGAYPR